MSTTDERIDQQDDQEWEPLEEDREHPEPGDLMLESDERTPEEAGYGYGV